MKRPFLIGMMVLVLTASNGFARMSTGQGGGRMGGGWGWRMNYGWFFVIIIAILLIFGIVYMKKRR